MRHRSIARLPALAAVAVLGLVGCGGGSEPSTSGPGGTEAVDASEPTAGEEIEAEVLHLAEGEPLLDRPRSVQVVPPDDVTVATRLFVPGERNAARRAIREAELAGRTPLAGVVHEGCFPAGGVSVRIVDEGVVFHAEDLDEAEGEVECLQPVVTAAVVVVDTDDLPAVVAAAATTTTTTVPDDFIHDGPAAGGDELDGEAVVVAPSPREWPDDVGPGLVRDAVDLEALLGRFDAGEPDPDLVARLEGEGGDEVLVPVVAAGPCGLPVGGTVVRTAVGVDVVIDFPDTGPDVECGARVSGLVVIAVAAADVAGVEEVAGDPADGPSGVGVVHAVEPLDVDADLLAGTLAEVDIATIPGAPDLDLPPVAARAVRLAFVVDACQPDTAELIADHDAGTVRVVAQQSGARVECEAPSPYLVVADLGFDHADLEPVTD